MHGRSRRPSPSQHRQSRGREGAAFGQAGRRTAARREIKSCRFTTTTAIAASPSLGQAMPTRLQGSII